MNRALNTYTPGQPLETALHAVGRPVSFFAPGGAIIAGTVLSLNTDGCTILAANGGTWRDAQLGTLMNPQPNTFVYAP